MKHFILIALTLTAASIALAGKTPPPTPTLSKDAQIVIPAQIISRRPHTIANAKPLVGHWMLTLFPGGDGKFPAASSVNYSQIYLYDPNGTSDVNGKLQYLDVYLNTLSGNPFATNEINTDARFTLDVGGQQESGEVKLGGDGSFTTVVPDGQKSYTLSCSLGDSPDTLWCTDKTKVSDSDSDAPATPYYGFVRVANLPKTPPLGMTPTPTTLAPTPVCANDANLQNMTSSELDAIFDKGTLNKTPGAYSGRWIPVIYPKNMSAYPDKEWQSATGDLRADDIPGPGQTLPEYSEDKIYLNRVVSKRKSAQIFYDYNPNGAHNNRCKPAYLDIKPNHALNPFTNVNDKNSNDDAVIAQANFIAERAEEVSPVMVSSRGYFTMNLAVQASIQSVSGGIGFSFGRLGGFYHYEERRDTNGGWFFESFQNPGPHFYYYGIDNDGFACVSVSGTPSAILCRVPINSSSAWAYVGFVREGARFAP